MLDRMFIGAPPGNFDRILDFSTAVTGTLFFVPTVDLLENPPRQPDAAAAAEEPLRPERTSDGTTAPSNESLGIGGLRGAGAEWPIRPTEGGV
jgi:putative iron-dependent peroxidase